MVLRKMSSKVMALLLLLLLFSFAPSALLADDSPHGFSGSSLLGSVPYSEDEGPVVITASFWETGERRHEIEQAIRDYQTLNPEVEIIAEFISPTLYWTNISADVAGGTLSDIIEMDASHIAQFFNRGIIVLADNPPYYSEEPIAYVDVALLSELGLSVPEMLSLDDATVIGSRVYKCCGVKTAVDYGIGLLSEIADQMGEGIFDQLAAGEEAASSVYFSFLEGLESSPEVSVNGERTWNSYIPVEGFEAVAAGQERPVAFLFMTTSSSFPEDALSFLSYLSGDDAPFSPIEDKESIPRLPSGSAEVAMLLLRISDEVIGGRVDAAAATEVFVSDAGAILRRAGL